MSTMANVATVGALARQARRLTTSYAAISQRAFSSQAPQGLPKKDYVYNPSDKEVPRDIAGVLDASAQTLFITEIARGMSLALKYFFTKKVTVSLASPRPLFSFSPDVLPFFALSAGRRSLSLSLPPQCVARLCVASIAGFEAFKLTLVPTHFCSLALVRPCVPPAWHACVRVVHSETRKRS